MIPSTLNLDAIEFGTSEEFAEFYNQWRQRDDRLIIVDGVNYELVRIEGAGE